LLTIANFLRLFAFFVVASFLYLVGVLADRPEARYTNNLRCHYKTTFEETGRADVVSMGTSRTLRAISGVHGGKEMSKLMGQDAVWLDLARSWRGRGQMYRQIDDILENRDVGVLAVEYFPDSRYYGHYAKTVKASDIVEDVFISRSSNFYQRSAFALRSLALKYSGFLTKPRIDKTNLPGVFSVFNEKNIDGKKTKTPLSKSVDCIKGESPLVPSKLNNWLKKNPKPDLKPHPVWDFDKRVERRNSGYIEKIIETADRHDVPIVFFYVPLLNQGVISDEAKQKFTTRFGKELVAMDIEEARGLYTTSNNYGDATHMRVGGRNYYTSWLANELLPELGERN